MNETTPAPSEDDSPVPTDAAGPDPVGEELDDRLAKFSARRARAKARRGYSSWTQATSSTSEKPSEASP